MVDVCLGGACEVEFTTDDVREAVEGFEVERVGDGDGEVEAVIGNGDGAVAASDVFGDGEDDGGVEDEFC